jgi:hypothetical protein
MSRKVFLSVLAAVLLLSLCAVEAADKKKKNVSAHVAMPCVFGNACMQTKSDVEKMQESCLQILAISVVVVGVVELANYFLSYRTASFKNTMKKLISAVCCVNLHLIFRWF